eukprot:gene26905-biopygen17487
MTVAARHPVIPSARRSVIPSFRFSVIPKTRFCGHNWRDDVLTGDG